MIVLHGVRELTAALEHKALQMSAATRMATAKALHLIERRTKQKLGQKSHQRGTPTPSNPGEPPALITGNLRRSITVQGPEPRGPGVWFGQVGPTAIYGRVQELGGGPRNLPTRPYLRPSYEEVKEEIRAIFETAWSEVILK